MTAVFLPQDTFLGRLEMVEVFAFYDKPVLFLCQNMARHHYLAVFVDETEDAEVWYYTSISPTRLADLRAGTFDLNTALLNAEDGIVFEIQRSLTSGQPTRITTLASHQMEASRLPQPGEYLLPKTPVVMQTRS